MLAFEIKKMMKIGRWALALYFIISIAMLFMVDTPDNADMEAHKLAYLDILENVQGPLTKEKEAWLNEQSNERTERSFEVLYDQYLHVHENPSNRYFLYTNGWVGLLSGSVLNISLLALVLLLIVPVFCGEYACQMNSLVLTAKRGRANTRMKLLLVLGVITLVCVTDAGLRYGFFIIKYGLPNGNYPLQSLPMFGASTKTISIAGGFLLVSVLRWMGALYLSAVVLLASVLTKKTAPTVFLSAAAVIIPYMGLSETEWYQMPLPLPFLLGTGFLEGSEYVTDFFTGETVPAFLEVSLSQLAVLAGVSVLICTGCILVLLYRYRNVWGVGKKRCLPVLCIILAFTFCLTGCGKTDPDHQIPYSDETHYETAEMHCYLDLEQNTVFKENVETGEVTDLLRSPLYEMSDVQIYPILYGIGNKVYYMSITTDSYINRVGEYAGTLNRVSVVEVDTENYQERIIFDRDVSNKRLVLGLEIPVSNEWQFLWNCTGFGVDEDNLYFVAGDIRKVSRATGEVSILEKGLAAAQSEN